MNGMNEKHEIFVNDGEVDAGLFSFSFTGGWVHDRGGGERQFGGDIHWTVAARAEGREQFFTLRFSGCAFALYGHGLPEGGTASVLLDGKEIGIVDYYHPARVEKMRLFESGDIPDGEHELKVLLRGESNEKATGMREFNIDGVSVTVSGPVPFHTVIPAIAELELEPGMQYPFRGTMKPACATEAPCLLFSAEDEAVAKTDGEGMITAVSEGETVIRVRNRAGNGQIGCETAVRVRVRKPQGGILAGAVSDTGVHTCSEDYYVAFKKLDVTKREIRAVAYRDDKVLGKIDLFTKAEPVRQVTLSCGDFTAADGTVLAGSGVFLSFIRELPAYDVKKSFPDILFGSVKEDLPAYTVCSAWISVRIPKEAAPGCYTGEILVRAESAEPLRFSVVLEVLALTLPRQALSLELWQYPYSSNRYYSGKSTKAYFGDGIEGVYRTKLDPAYDDALRKQIAFYREAGGNFVTVTIVEDPWNSQTPDPYPSMVKWTRHGDGRFSFDYEDFDKWVGLNLEGGIDGPILSFSMADWANNVTYYDEDSSRVVRKDLVPGSPEWKDIWTQFLRSYVAHTEEKGWFDRVYMSIDERPAALVGAVLDLVESVKNSEGKHFKTSLAVYSFECAPLFDRIASLSFAYQLPEESVRAYAERRRARGLKTTIYTCGAQKSALANPPYESTYSIWHVAKCGMDGFLRWALDAFNDEPLQSSFHLPFAAGDIFLIYPSPKTSGKCDVISSVRFEKLLEGCRDVAKLRDLAQRFPACKERLSALLLSLGTQNGGSMPGELKRVRKELDDIAREMSGGVR